MGERTDSETLDDGTKIGGEPTGKFWMTKSTTLAASKEVLNTHKGLSGAALASYLDTYFDKAWAHFDVNKGGDLEVIKMPQFMRFLCSDQYMSLGESGRRILGTPPAVGLGHAYIPANREDY